MEANLQDKPILLHLRPSLELRQPNYFTTRRRHRRAAATAVAACLDLLVMYSAQPTGADGATINPAALNSDIFSAPPRGIKRNRSPDLIDSHRPGDDGDRYLQPKRIRPMKARTTGSISEAPGQAPGGPVPQAIPPPQAPQSQNPAIPTQTTPSYSTPQAQLPPKPAPAKTTLKALPTVRDHTTDQLNPSGDEYIPRETDEFGEKKVMPNGQLLGNRQYRCRTFLVPNRGDKLFMLATECARVLGYRDSYLLFNKNRSLYKIIASQAEKDDLVQQEILPFSYRSRQIAIVTARSMFRQFGSRVIENGRRVRDDYWETKARKQGFTEADPAGEKRPGAAKAREAAEAAQNNVLLGNPHTEIVYNNTPGPYPGAPQPHLVQDLSDSRSRDYGGIVKGGPRQEITGPPYQDQTRPSPLVEIHSQAHHAADFNRSVNQQRDMRDNYLQGIWRRPHEQPTQSALGQQPVAASADPTIPTSRPTNSPHTSAAGIAQPGIVSSQSPQMMMTAAPYSQSISAQSALGQAPIRGSTGSISAGTAGYSYQQPGQMWSQSPQTPQTSYSSYTTQPQAQHPSQSPASQLRQTGASQMQPGMQFPGMGSMQYSTSQGIAQSASQPWSGQHQQSQQWWTPQQQQ
ncbi:chromatin remodelling complex rsc7/Swp82 subunit domain-containing protein [Trichoderma breve]|uniref:Chromatin remodelling complex rsc7/Swp82 subunit domain-containing protein n=1 Tax=Trichoderma breve TaxID=2034170 RepID=A0A9W9ECL5_9HYPO|nr:chromatin remodelling complex rsc7/Swp82 subunit domain-containing protein [Trichoderma breve]KAJ4864251.1 chromatin remodelling complex rsc7/Swp82 subunit domain-containing protein [Trichoderma breve]